MVGFAGIGKLTGSYNINVVVLAAGTVRVLGAFAVVACKLLESVLYVLLGRNVNNIRYFYAFVIAYLYVIGKIIVVGLTRSVVCFVFFILAGCEDGTKSAYTENKGRKTYNRFHIYVPLLFWFVMIFELKLSRHFCEKQE